MSIPLGNRSCGTSPLTSLPASATCNFGSLQPQTLKPRRKCLCHALFESGNGKCALLSLTVVAFLALSTWCQVSQEQEIVLPVKRYYHDPEENQCLKYLAVPIIFASLFYIIYLMENWQYYLKQKEVMRVSIPSIETRIDKMKRSLPVIWWRVTCYHYTVHPCRRGGHARVVSSVNYQRVSSCSGVGRYNYLLHGFRDVSSIIQGLSLQPATKIHFTKSFVFFTQQAAKEFEEQRRDFFRDYENRDDYLEMREGMDLLMDIDFAEDVIVERDDLSKMWYSRRSVFLLASLFLMAAPLRIYKCLQTATLNYTVLKVFGMDARESNWNSSPLPVTPTALVTPPGYVDPVDLLPPSYSQIMLQTYVDVSQPAKRPVTLPLQSCTTEHKNPEKWNMAKSATVCFGLRTPKSGDDLATGIRARGATTPGYTPVTPAAEQKTLSYFEVLQRNPARVVGDGRKLPRSQTAPDLGQVSVDVSQQSRRLTSPQATML